MPRLFLVLRLIATFFLAIGLAFLTVGFLVNGVFFFVVLRVFLERGIINPYLQKYSTG